MIREGGELAGWPWLTLVPIVVTAILAWSVFVPLPIADYWDVLVPGWAAANEGPAALAAFLWQPFVDQTMVLPKASILALAKTSHGPHLGIELALGFAAQLVVLACVRAMATRSELAPRAQQTLVVAAAFVLFWPLLLVRFQHHWYSTQYAWVTCTGLAGLLALHTRWGRWSGLLLGMLGGIATALSHGTGLFLMPAVAALLLVVPGWSRPQRMVWWLVTIGLLGLLLAHMPTATDVGLPAATERLASAAQIPAFFLRCLGPPWQRLLCGTLLCLVGAVAIWRLWRCGRLSNRAVFPWVALLGWGYLCAAATTVARLGMDKPPRWYFAFFALPAIATLAVALHAFCTVGERAAWRTRWQHRRWLRPALLAAALAIWMQGSWIGLREARATQAAIIKAGELLRFAPVLVTEDTKDIFPHHYFLTQLLPGAVALGFHPGAVDLRPFDQQRALGVACTQCEGLTASATPTVGGFEFTASANEAFVVVQFAAPVEPGDVVSCHLELAAGVAASVEWHDGKHWSQPLALQGRARGDRTTMFFVDANGKLPRAPVTQARLRFSAPPWQVGWTVRFDTWRRESRSH